MGVRRNHQVMERRRLRAAGLFDQGLSPAEVGRRLGVRRQSAHAWYQAWRARGARGLRSRGRAGRRARLSEPQRLRIRKALSRSRGGALRAGKGLPRTLREWGGLIESVTGERFHVGHLGRLLVSLGVRRRLKRKRKGRSTPTGKGRG